MGSKWPNVQLGDYCFKIGSGATPKGGSSVYLDVGEVSLIRSQNIHNDDFKADGLVFISPIAASKLSNVTVELSDVLLNITGDSVARVCMAPEEYLPARVNQHVAIIRPNPKEFDARFLRYFLTTPHSQATLLTLASAGATRNALTKSMIEGLVVPKPPLGIQKEIADKLYLLDSKIKLNQKTNQTLEKMAQALFKSWFVDFDPVIDNALAAGNLIPDELQERAELRQRVIAERTTNPKLKPLPDDIQHLFPSEFEQCGDYAIGIAGWIPKGWKVSTTGEHFSFQNGYAFKSMQMTKEEGIPVFKMGHIKRGGGFKADGTKSYFPDNLVDDKISSYFIKKGDLLMSMTDMKSNMVILGNTALMPESDKFLLNQRCGLLRKNKATHLNYSYMYYFTNDKTVVKELRSRANSGVQVNLTATAIKETILLVPSVNVHEIFDSQVSSYLEKTFINDKNIKCLTKLRDTLLPKLIAGEIKIPDVKTA
jgi:type I restriction enzyme S subunit